jgi:hypothetical protein
VQQKIMKKPKSTKSAPVSLLAGLAIVSLLGAGSVSAGLYSSYSIAGQPGNVSGTGTITGTVQVGGGALPGQTYQSFDSLSPGQTTTFTSGSFSAAFTPNAGEDAPGSANPVLTGNNNVFFETPSSLTTGGVGDTTPWVATGYAGDGGTITFNFGASENYLGLLWGSVDYQNGLTFWSGANGTGSIVGSLSGLALEDADLQINGGSPPTEGSTGVNGTVYVNIDTSAAFESVVASSGYTTFEIDNMAYGTTCVPDSGMTMTLLGGALVGLQALRRKMLK